MFRQAAHTLLRLGEDSGSGNHLGAKPCAALSDKSNVVSKTEIDTKPAQPKSRVRCRIELTSSSEIDRVRVVEKARSADRPGS